MRTASISEINAASVDVLKKYGQPFVGEASHPQDVSPGTEVFLHVDPLGMVTRILSELEITLTNSSTTDAKVAVAPFGLATYFSRVKITRPGAYSNYETPGYAIGSINQKRSFGLMDGNTPVNSLNNTSSGLTAPGSTVTVPASGRIVLKDLFPLELVQDSQTLNGIVWVESQQMNQTTVFFESRQNFFGDNPLEHPFIGAAPSGVKATATVSITAYGIRAPSDDVYKNASKTHGFDVPRVPPVAASVRYSLRLLSLTSPVFANSNNLVSLPANVTIISAFVWFNNGNRFNQGTDIASFRRYDSGPVVSPKIMTFDVLTLGFIEKHGNSLRNGVYCFESEHPLLQQFGLHRLEIVPTEVNAGAYLTGACEVLEGLPRL